MAIPRALRVAVLSSHRCPGAEDLLRDLSRGRRWELAGVVTTEEDFSPADASRFAAAGVPLVPLSIRAFHRERGRRPFDLSFRTEWDAEVAARLAPFRPDLLLFSSYLYVATPVLLRVTRGRAINVHASDLTVRRADGTPRYVGLRAVRDAILAGERQTRATAHWVTDEVDMGPPILRSRPFPVPPWVGRLRSSGNEKAVRAYAHAHQEWMLQEGFGPLWTASIGLVAGGRTIPFTHRRAATPVASSAPELVSAGSAS
jgi:folate-dependent phosphoribosylglycinamide formyltransferase PurN